jgi:hypothetical protein
LREEFIALLVRLVMDGVISEEQAGELLDEFDETGSLPDGWDLPLPLALAILDLEQEIINERIAPLARQGELALDRLQDVFIAEANSLALQYGRGFQTLKEWHRQFRDELISYLSTMAVAGAGHNLEGDDAEPVFELILVQLAFLSRFADRVATGELSTEQIAARAKLYAGEGRRIFYEQQEQIEVGARGMVVDYIAVDDRATCRPCRLAEAAGPYLPGEGPFPGNVCLGRGYCRCRRVIREDMQAYLALTGQTARA